MAGKTKSKREVAKDKFFAFLGATSLADGLDRDHVHLGHSYGRNYLFLGWSHQPYEEAVQAVHEIRPGVSEKTIGKVLTQSMVKLFHQHNIREDADPEADAPVLDSILETLDSSAVNEEVASFLKLLKSQIRTWTAFVFLEGVELKGLVELPLGVATLYPRNRGPLYDALEEVKTVKGLDGIPKSVEELAGHCCCYLTINIEGEDDFVAQQALRQAQGVASVLNLYAVSSKHRASYECIGVLGRPTITRRQLVLRRTPPIGEDVPSPRYSYSEKFPPARRYEIDSVQVDRWREHGLYKVLGCIEPQDFSPGSAESRIHNAIVWYERAMNAYSEDEQFVDLIIALESLLVANEDVASITQRLADGVSALLGTDFQSRERISREAKDLYNLRGRLVHAGMPVSQENLFHLDYLVANTILAFVRREIPIQ